MFIDHKFINKLLSKKAADKKLLDILSRAEMQQRLDYADLAALLTTENPMYISRIFSIASRIRSRAYNNRVDILAPLCITSAHQSGLTYLSPGAVRIQAATLGRLGYRRLLLEEELSDDHDIEHVAECVRAINDGGEHFCVSVCLGDLSEQDYKRLMEADIDSYIFSHDTYHRPTYEVLHPDEASAYEYNLAAFNRAIEAGLDNLGTEIMLGLHDCRFETLALVMHNRYLEEIYGKGFRSISMRRTPRGEGDALSEEDIKRATAVIRIAAPQINIIQRVSEKDDALSELIQVGVSHIIDSSQNAKLNQDTIAWLMNSGFIPGLCSVCHSKRLVCAPSKGGSAGSICVPNALMTLAEYSAGIEEGDFKNQLDTFITSSLVDISNEQLRRLTATNVEKIKKGQRDLFI